MSIAITIVEKTGEVTTYPFEKEGLVFGRSRKCDLTLDPIRYGQVSRRHGAITFQGGQYILEDLESSHGIYIDGRRMHGTYVLKRGDSLRLGKDGPVLILNWEISRITGNEGTHIRLRTKDSPEFPLVFSSEFKGLYSRYTKVAVGGYGEVWKALRKDTDQTVAVKLLHPTLIDPEYLQDTERKSLVNRFSREAHVQHLLSNIEDSGVVPVYRWGDDPDRDYLFIEMEFIHGQPLDSIIIKETFLKPLVVYRYFHAVAKTLAIAHGFEFTDRNGRTCQGVIHRDLRPGNIMIESSTNEVRILDFGIAAIEEGSDHLTYGSSLVGSDLFLPPETLSRKEVSHMTDLWSFCVSLYLSLCGGNYPYEGSSRSELLRNIESANIKPPSTFRMDLNKIIVDALLKGLSSDPERRIQTADEWRRILQHVIAKEEAQQTDI